MDRYYYSPFDYCDSPLYRTDDYPNQYEEAPSMHQHWSGQHQMGNPHTNNFHYGWEGQLNFSRGEGNDQGAPNFPWEPMSQFAMPDPSHMTTHHPPPSEHDELKQLLLNGFSEINAKIDEERSSSESCFSNILKRMEQMEEKHEHLHSRVMQFSDDMNEPRPLTTSGSMDNDCDEEDEEVEENIICEGPPLHSFGLLEDSMEVEVSRRAEAEEKSCIEDDNQESLVTPFVPFEGQKEAEALEHNEEAEESGTEGFVSEPSDKEDQALMEVTMIVESGDMSTQDELSDTPPPPTP